MSQIADYINAGWALVPIPKGTKGPRSKGWNLRENCKLPPGWAGNIGLAHAYSGTCCIDFDRLDDASKWLAEHGIDAQALLSSPRAVRITSGRPNRAKLLYRLEAPLRSLKLAEGALELRCATSTGTTVQDVLPPSVHPVTRQPYVWEYGDELVGDWRYLPTLPEPLRALWQTMTAHVNSPYTAPVLEWTGDEKELEARLRAAVAPHDPDCGYDQWLKIGMALHHGSGGSTVGLGVWDEWSAKSSKYPGSEKLEQHWASFRSDGAGPKITLASLRVEATPDIDAMEDLSQLATATEKASNGTAEEANDPPVVTAQTKCSDQANAARIMAAFGHKLMVCAGRFYAWTGTHWNPNGETEAARCAAQLSVIVRREAKQARLKADKHMKQIPAELLAAAAEHPVKNSLKKTEAGKAHAEMSAVADQLDAWVKECEMAHRQQAALGLLRRLIDVPPEALDRDPFALNCLNGTIDLRTGAIAPHNPMDYITRCCPVAYDPRAEAPRWRQFLVEIMSGDEARASFLQRWFGYCATGSVREQKLVCHVGQGANGKSTMLDAIQDVLNGYSGTGAPGLLTTSGNGSERHPTEIADLFGRRMVTVHETDVGAELREGFVKQATGGDRLKARHMREDFFEFKPTHKLQLLTNNKPSISGSDLGIWRRICLVTYYVTYGTAHEVSEGRRQRLKDPLLPEQLHDEREGIFAWMVEGARDWYEHGLQEPDAVVHDVLRYQLEQDRIGQFIAEHCELGQDYWQPWTGADGLYTMYTLWCKTNGYRPFGKGRFANELERLVPGFVSEARNVGTGKDRRKPRGAKGIRLQPDAFDSLT